MEGQDQRGAEVREPLQASGRPLTTTTTSCLLTRARAASCSTCPGGRSREVTEFASPLRIGCSPTQATTTSASRAWTSAWSGKRPSSTVTVVPVPA